MTVREVLAIYQSNQSNIKPGKAAYTDMIE